MPCGASPISKKRREFAGNGPTRGARVAGPQYNRRSGHRSNHPARPPMDDDAIATEEPIVTVHVAEAPKSEVDEETKTRRQPPYHVILLNDEEHTFEYVIELLMK